MRHLTLMTTAAVLALGLAGPADAQSTEAPGGKSDITIAADTVPSTTGVEDSAAGEGATNKNSAIDPSSGAGSSRAGGPPGLEPGTGVEDSAQGEGATAKQGKPDMKEGKLSSSSSTY